MNRVTRPTNRKIGLGFGKRALSPIFATLILAAIVIIFGSVAYYYASNVTTTATNQYTASAQQNQQSVSERIAFESVTYASSKLTVYVLNCGTSDNVQITGVFLYDSNHQLQGAYSSGPSGKISGLSPIDAGTPIPTNSLNVGKEGSFTVTLSQSLSPGFYTVHIITARGNNFDYDFTL